MDAGSTPAMSSLDKKDLIKGDIMLALLGLAFDLVMNVVTLGWWGRSIGDDIVYMKGDGFSRPDNE